MWPFLRWWPPKVGKVASKGWKGGLQRLGIKFGHKNWLIEPPGCCFVFDGCIQRSPGIFGGVFYSLHEIATIRFGDFFRTSFALNWSLKLWKSWASFLEVRGPPAELVGMWSLSFVFNVDIIILEYHIYKYCIFIYIYICIYILERVYKFPIRLLIARGKGLFVITLSSSIYVLKMFCICGLYVGLSLTEWLADGPTKWQAHHF